MFQDIYKVAEVSITSGIKLIFHLNDEISRNFTFYVASGTTILLSYNILVRYWRNQRASHIKKLCKEAIDGKHSLWWMIVLLSEGEFNFEYILSMEFRGLLSTYGIPTISSTLRKTGGFQKEMQSRYADMVLLINEFTENGFDNDEKRESQSDRRVKAIKRLNAIHNQYGKLILDRDMLYTLTVFAMTPIVWAESKWSIRPFTDEEKQVQYLYWMDIGKDLNIKIDPNWKTHEDCLKFKRDYESKYMKYTENNKIITFTTIEYFLNSFSWILRPIIKPIFYSLLSAMQESDLQREALGLEMKPNYFILILLDTILLLRKYFVINFVPPMPLGTRERITGQKGRNTINSALSHCPMSTMYYPRTDLEFNNKTYTPYRWWNFGSSKGYFIENMGPSEIKKGLLVDTPEYTGKEN